MSRIVFMGTPDFAVPALRFLCENDEYEVLLVICQADKPQGRHQVLTPPPVKQIALQYGVEVYQPATLKSDEAYEKIAALSPDFIVVSAYGKILPQRILDIPVYGCVNLHGSLLPKYRGAAPIQWSVINGDKKSGVTSMLMNAGLDTGDILLTAETEISENETAGELFDALACLCPDLLHKTLTALLNKTVVPVQQDDAQATYVSMLSKEMATICFDEPAISIHNKIRGLNPWPTAKTLFDGKILKIHASRLTNSTSGKPAGYVTVEGARMFVTCADNQMLELTEVQLEGAKRMSAADFLRGHANINGTVL